MTNIKSIYGSYENSNAEEAEVIIKTQMDECFEHFLSLMEDLIIEDNRNKKNLRYIRSEKLLVNGMALHLTYIEIINVLIFDYIYLYIFSRLSYKPKLKKNLILKFLLI